VAAILDGVPATPKALTGFLAEDKIPGYFRLDAANHFPILPAQAGQGQAAPYNFFYGPSYSDALRGMLAGPADDWKAKGKPGQAEIRSHGSEPPLPENAPKAAGEAPPRTETRLRGVAADRVRAEPPGDYSAQCLTLKELGRNYAYLGKYAGSNISGAQCLKTAGVDVQFLGNVWGMDENAAKAAGAAADGVVFPLRTAVAWGRRTAPGMKTVMEISKCPDAARYCFTARSLHRRRGVPPLNEGGRRVGRQRTAGATGENVKKGFTRKPNWFPAGMDGVCKRLNMGQGRTTAGFAQGRILYRMKRSPERRAPLNDLVQERGIKLEKNQGIDFCRARPNGLGW